MKNNIIPPANSIFIFCSILSAFLLQGCVAGRDQSIREWERSEWHVVKTDNSTKPSWRISYREIAGTNFSEYKIEGEIPSTPTGCLAVFQQDLHQLADDTTNKKYPVYDISEASEKSYLTYVIHNEPFPLKDTEMSVRYQFIRDEDGATGVTWREAWEDCPIPPSKNLKRVESFRGSWHFTPTGDNTSQAINSVLFDPQKMPKWLFEPMVEKFLVEGLKDLRANQVM